MLILFFEEIMVHLINVFAILLSVVSVHNNVRADDTLWIRYRQAVEKIKDFECEYHLLSPPITGLSLVSERGAEDGGDGLLVQAKFKPFRWSALRHRVYFDEYRFEGLYFPPNDWQHRIVFYDGDTSGIYLPFLRFGEIRSLPPEEVGLYPNPATFLKPLKCDLGSIEATRTWKLSEKDSNRLELDVDFGGVPWKYEIEIAPEHGFLPKSFKAFPVAAASSYNEFINESFLQIDGIWFPVKSRLRYYRGTALGPIFQTERIVVVDTATLRINQQFGAEDFQYRFPDKISIHNQITGQITDPPEAAEVFNAFHKLPKRNPLAAEPTPAEVRKTWLVWTWRIAVIGLAFLAFSLLIWNRSRIRELFTTGSMCLAVIILGGSGCGSYFSSDASSEIELAISELLRTETVAKDGIVVKISQR